MGALNFGNILLDDTPKYTDEEKEKRCNGEKEKKINWADKYIQAKNKLENTKKNELADEINDSICLLLKDEWFKTPEQKVELISTILVYANEYNIEITDLKLYLQNNNQVGDHMLLSGFVLLPEHYNKGYEQEYFISDYIIGLKDIIESNRVEGCNINQNKLSNKYL